jgi:lipopolysaccharide biosynthesis glycosyltransferase
MQSNSPLSIFIGFDSREAVTADVLSHSIKKRTDAKVDIQYLKHRELRKRGFFKRPWLIESETGEFKDLIDNKPFSTEFSHTRFLVPALMKYKGWALFQDSDMLCLSDIKKLFALCDDKYAVMCVKHQHKVNGLTMKMDGRQQLSYHRKNWSSFVLFNCSHPSNKILTPAEVNSMKGSDLHSFAWLKDHEIGELPTTYNFIPGVSPKMPHSSGGMPDVIHYTEGGPWFDECKDGPYFGMWTHEYEDWQQNGFGGYSDVPTTKYDAKEDNVR